MTAKIPDTQTESDTKERARFNTTTLKDITHYTITLTKVFRSWLDIVD